MISTKNLSITVVTKNSVNSKPLSNSKSLPNDQQNLGSNLHRVRNHIWTLLTQSDISLIAYEYH